MKDTAFCSKESLKYCQDVDGKNLGSNTPQKQSVKGN